MNTINIDDRLTTIERRLSKIEQRLSIPVDADSHQEANEDARAVDAQAVVDDRGWSPPPPPPLDRPLAPPPLPPANVAAVHAAPGLTPSSEPFPLWPPTAINAALRLQRQADAVPPRPALPVVSVGDDDFEQTIGLKWAGWVGAVVLAIGAALGIKFAYDQGWFGLVSPAVRLGLMSLGGVALLAAGEIVYRRVNRVSAASLYGAGLAVFFLVSYAGHGYYDLYGRDAAFAFMALSTLLGAAVAVRGGMVSIATLALIGGNVAPLVLRSEDPRLVPFLAYLLMLQIVAVALAAWGRERRWWTLRGLSLTTTALWVTSILASGAFAGGAYGPLFGFVLLSAALYHAELIASAFRADRRVPLATEAVDAFDMRLGAAAPGYGVTVTALAVAALLVHLRGEPDATRALIVCLAGAATAALGFLLPAKLGRVSVPSQSTDPTPFRRRPEGPASGGANDVVLPTGETALNALGIGFRVQAAGLLVLAVPVALSGLSVLVAWGVLSVCFAVTGVLVASRISRRAAVVTWALALVQLLHWGAGSWMFRAGGGIRPDDPVVTLMGSAIPACAAAAWLLALIGHVVAAVLPLRRAIVNSDEAAPPVAAGGNGPLNYEAAPATTWAHVGSRDLAAVVQVAAGIVVGVASIVTLPAVGATIVLLIYAGLLVAANWFLPRLGLSAQALAVLALAAGKWFVIDTLAARFAPGWAPVAYPMLLNPHTFLAAAIVGGLAYAARRLPDDEAELPAGAVSLRAVVKLAAVIVVLWCGSFEIDRAFEQQAAADPSAWGGDPRRAKGVALSIFWATFGVASVAAGFAARAAGLRYLGLALLAVTLVKVVAVDLSEVRTGYRVLSFMALGLLLMGTSVLYGKLSPRLLRKTAEE